jgi:hypothetical protein
MSSFHAVYSVGGFLGAAIGGLCARAGLTPRSTFLIAAGIVAALAILATVWALPSTVSPEPEDGAAPARPLGSRVLFLGLLVFRRRALFIPVLLVGFVAATAGALRTPARSRPA